MVERMIRTFKEQCATWHRFESLTHAMRTIADWIHFYGYEWLRQMVVDEYKYIRSSVCFSDLTCAGATVSLHFQPSIASVDLAQVE